MKQLTPKQELFCREYLKDLNATQAAIRAGYSEKTAQVQSSRLLSNVMVQQRVGELAAERNIRVGIDADYVLRQAVKLHERCMQEVEPITDRRGEEITDEDGKTIFGFDAKGAAAALKLVGEHISVQAFKVNVKTEHAGMIGLNLNKSLTELFDDDSD
ncbi:terminase small subunit [Yersinia enterocolitica]|uniref:terminase small subunit n=1 Tax=Yersinia enterocolitica TaxID=630 RepID=UPI0005E123EE|nr:terminase small subunit [Yersinia enterocolitica]EKN4744818.1 terminase small subunit [Yersinia enterocolitica]EKN4840980.1 terminase small subunit [Yersinia enterocolitica]EKN4877988.1 terminase small subunit [Yersinia enterocolitica]EKN5157538.1 terminase small subunit [Yersinia enterocolitica]CQJ65569.1 putative phage terminase%2C small subunit [Yersinia enterocolitica]